LYNFIVYYIRSDKLAHIETKIQIIKGGVMMAKITNKDSLGNPIEFERMIRRFKKLVIKEGILEEVKKHQYFISKSQARRRKSEKHQRLLRKLLKKSQKHQDDR